MGIDFSFNNLACNASLQVYQQMKYDNLYRTITRALQQLRADAINSNATDWQKTLESQLNEAWQTLHPVMRTATTLPHFEDINQGLIGALSEFFKVSEVSKEDFAEKYGVSPYYISRLLSGDREINFVKFAQVIDRFGYGLKIDTTQGDWEVVPKV